MSYFKKISVEDKQRQSVTEVNAFGSLKTITPVRLVGTAFSGSTKDPNFWAEAVTGSGVVTQAGEVLLKTGVTADSAVKYVSVRKARKIPGAGNQFRFVGRLTTDPQANNLRRCGAYDANNGFFFQVNGEAFGVGARKGGVDTIVNSGSFNGNLGARLDLDTTFGKFIIEYDHLGAKFFVDGVLLHKLMATTTSLTTSLDLPILMENINSGGNTTDNGFEILFATIMRLGQMNTAATYKSIVANATTVLKYGAGNLHAVINTDNAGTITVYDATASTAGTEISVIDATKVLGPIDFHVDFSTGLTVVTAGGAKCTVIYE